MKRLCHHLSLHGNPIWGISVLHSMPLWYYRGAPLNMGCEFKRWYAFYLCYYYTVYNSESACIATWIHRWSVDSSAKGTVMSEKSPYGDVSMYRTSFRRSEDIFHSGQRDPAGNTVLGPWLPHLVIDYTMAVNRLCAYVIKPNITNFI